MKKTAVITGASSGIGEAYAKQLAESGYHLVLVARSKDKMDALAEGLIDQHGIEIEVIGADLTQEIDLNAICEVVKRDDVEMLVNNAGVGTIASFTDTPIERYLEEINLNIVALVKLTHAALHNMVLKNHGFIINVSSTLGFMPSPYSAHYGATKAHILNFTQALNDEVRHSGVFLQAVCPALVETNFQNYASNGLLHAPKYMFIKPEQVVKDSLKDLKKRKEVSIPALHHRLLINTGRILPNFLSRQVINHGTRLFLD